MSLLFDWYETPDSHGKPEDEKVLYPRVCLRHRCSTDDLCDEIERMTTAHRADILLVLSALSDVVGRRLNNGCQVHLNGLGYFNMTLTTGNRTVPTPPSLRRLQRASLQGNYTYKIERI